MTGHPMRLPLFPLNTVLSPGGALPLRVFEARYMDMVRRAMRDGGEFGVVLIRSGAEVGTSGVQTEDVGCRARIEDWNMEQFGVLQIATIGTERFRIEAREIAADGLINATVAALEEEPAVTVPEESLSCRTFLERIVQRLDEERNRIGADAATLAPPIAQPYRFDDATWVGNRLAELLPVSLATRQNLMTLTDAAQRLALIRQFLDQNGIS